MTFECLNSGDPYQYIRTGNYANILAKESAAENATHSGKWHEMWPRQGGETAKKKPARVIYW